ncbi:4Fe-4S binding protein [Candidatus Woesearchaeota archaeon]|nr:4Fe-4S binding protein [Candidatus Woesearchaeota archaeon]
MKFNIGAVITEPGSSKKNKTGGWRTLKPVINKDKCIKCGKCWQSCPDNAIIMDKKDGKAKVDYDFCKGCGICATECPVKCIEMVKEKK